MRRISTGRLTDFSINFIQTNTKTAYLNTSLLVPTLPFPFPIRYPYSIGLVPRAARSMGVSVYGKHKQVPQPREKS